MLKDQKTNDEIRKIIIDIVDKQKPETAKQLIDLIQGRYDVPHEKTINLLLELENEGQLHFTERKVIRANSGIAYMLSQRMLWYWTTVVVAIVTTIAVFTISDSNYPMVYLRLVLGISFVLFLPGYASIKLLFPTNLPKNIPFLTKDPKDSRNENIDTMEMVTLSTFLSLVITTIVGLVLNYSPWGIRLAPITLSLLALTVAFATVAMVRNYQESNRVNNLLS